MNEKPAGLPTAPETQPENQLKPFFDQLAQEQLGSFIDQLPLPDQAKQANWDRVGMYAMIGYQKAVEAKLQRPLTDEEVDQTRTEFLEKMYDPTWMSSLEQQYPQIKDSLREVFAKFREHTQRSVEAAQVGLPAKP